MSPSPLAPYRHRNFRTIASAAGLSLVGTSITAIALPLYIIEAGGGAALAGLLATLRLVGGLVMPLIGGVLADRFPRRVLFISADAVRVVCLIAVLSAVWADNGIVIIAIAVAIEGLVGTILSPAIPPAIRTSLEGADLQQGILAWQSLSISVMIVGPVLGGLLLSVDHVIPFAVNAMTYALSLLIILFSRADFGGGKSPSTEAQQEGTIGRQIWFAVQTVLTNPYLRVYSIVACIINFTSAAALFIMPIAVAEGTPDGVIIAGVAMSIFAICGLVGTIAANWLKTERDLLMMTLYVAILGGCYLIIGLSGNIFILIGIMATTSLAMPILQIRMGVRFIEATPEEQIGKIQGALGVVASMLYPFAAVVAGLMHQLIGPWVVFVALGLVTLAPLVLFSTRWFRLPSGEAAVEALSRIRINEGEGVRSHPSQSEG